MIKLEHLNLVVEDMQSTLDFYQTAFPHWQIRTRGESDWYGTKRQWLHFGDDYNYLTFNDNGSGEARNLKSNDLGLAHIGFKVSDLNAMNTRMSKAGFEPSHQGVEHAFRANLYYIDPNGIEVEFVEYQSDIPAERNSD